MGFVIQAIFVFECLRINPILLYFIIFLSIVQNLEFFKTHENFNPEKFSYHYDSTQHSSRPQLTKFSK